MSVSELLAAYLKKPTSSVRSVEPKIMYDEQHYTVEYSDEWARYGFSTVDVSVSELLIWLYERKGSIV